MVLRPPFLPRTLKEEEEEADRKGEVAETGKPLQQEVGDWGEVKAVQQVYTLNKMNKTLDGFND